MIENQNITTIPSADGKERTVRVACALHGCATGTFDGIVQVKQEDGSWTPPVARTLDVCGWTERGGLMFCSRRCADLHAHVTAQVPLTPVARVNDRGFNAHRAETIDRSIRAATVSAINTTVEPKPRPARTPKTSAGAQR